MSSSAISLFPPQLPLKDYQRRKHPQCHRTAPQPIRRLHPHWQSWSTGKKAKTAEEEVAVGEVVKVEVVE